MDLVKRAWWAFRSLIFYCGFVAIVAIMSTIACLLFFLPFRPRQRIATFGNHLVMLWLALTCDIRITVSGRENIPEGPCVILSNHQSTWETFYLQWFFQPASVILKRGLMWVPLFGWGLALMQPIAIKRSQPAKAIRYVLKQGMRRIAGGNRIVIYPEGTRVSPEQLGVFKTSGAALAKSAGVAILPVAHNAGEYWARDSFIKRPGTIHLHIGPAIDSQCGDPRQLTEQAKDWIQRAL
ncbi:MAG: 1-acyl-sn-glycerol-3-phosphate acyltransferase [Porticoccaceae bacterium]|jgi:1-acyl-sn-glycerol-3-phosphate acyltransferase|nr:1-acyl-sn-glycerol-3-phosphate acyltransferase [Porticoccaceae bacterium]MBT5577898.1 1-acyl-sn-glycerol-3-phosphate acyltransferase [Porticoccaceae bacterium]MBT7375135.1 1-acyl-sn-glycerol-3-phosphate acyltransferase [Porticoccaceae bacterium]